MPQFVPYFGHQGIGADVVRLSASPVNRWSQFLRARQYDIVILQRRLLQPWDVSLLRRAARHLVFDFDDAVMYRSSKWKNPKSRSRMLKFKKTVEACDLIFAGNNFLKKETERFVPSHRVHMIPTVVDLERYTPKNQAESHDRVTFGWIGSRGTLPYLKGIMPALEGLSERCGNVQLKIVCDEFLESRRIPIVKKIWEERTEVEDVKSFDVGIMPLSDDLWARGKCALKIIQCLAVGVPVVCSPVGTNRDIIRNGLNGFWARTHEEWVESLSALAEDSSLRQKMGLAGRTTVAECYSVQAVGDMITSLMQTLVGRTEDIQ